LNLGDADVRILYSGINFLKYELNISTFIINFTYFSQQNFDVFRMPTTTPAEQSASNTNGEEKEAQPFPLDEPIEKLFQNESDFILLLKSQIVAQN